MEDKKITEGLVELTADIVSAYVSNNTVVSSDLPSLINDTYDALSKAAAKAAQPIVEELNPAGDDPQLPLEFGLERSHS